MRINLSQKPNPSKTANKDSHQTQSMTWLLLVFVTMVLSACGNKGDLYIPETEDTQEPAASAGEQQSKP